ncbi:olfactory receptor 10A7-like [Rhinoderma darwinii]|uniref:olfactory receptor 10A7-like n=1 Tax=Rhinoderma darwinii TaxID=43563 RepID=UPI003F66989E
MPSLDSGTELGRGFSLIKNEDGGLSPCIVYRELNRIIIKNKYPLPLISELLKPNDGIHQAAFIIRDDHNEYLAIPIGLSFHHVFRIFDKKSSVDYTVKNTGTADGKGKKEWKSHLFPNNKTQVTEFILVGLSTEFQPYLFTFFLLIYLLTLTGNVMIALTITLESKLHSPMYLFLRSLSVTEIFYVTTTLPRMLRDFLHIDKAISFAGCAAQLYFFSFLGAAECFILAFMAYDRYVAICHPLQYMTIMTKKKCLQFSVASWVGGMVLPMANIVLVFCLPYCDSNVVDHFFCDILPVMRLACTNTYANEIGILVYSFVVVPLPFLLIIVSYLRILIAVFKIRSASGRSKVFSTCGSHLTSVSLFYGSATITYVRTKPIDTHRGAKALSLLYLVFVPMLNPLIYSLRNAKVKKAMKRVIVRLFQFQR